MSSRPFIDHYEVLQLSPNATPDTVERVYRMLAKRFHPDNQETGDATMFAKVLDAYGVLSSPERRASYDVTYDDNRAEQWKIFDQQSASDGREEDRRIFHGILSLLYVARRRDPSHGGLGPIQLERLLGVAEQHLAFPLWYLKQHGWIEVLDTGQLAITVEGIDKLGNHDLTLPANRLLGASSRGDGAAASEAAQLGEPVAGE